MKMNETVAQSSKIAIEMMLPFYKNLTTNPLATMSAMTLVIASVIQAAGDTDPELLKTFVNALNKVMEKDGWELIIISR